MSSAVLSLLARVEGLQPDTVQRALWEDRSLVKTWAMRGTLHLIPSAELPVWQATLSLYRHYVRPVWLRAFGVSRDELETIISAVGTALEGPPLTRVELAAEVARLTGSLAMGEKVATSWGTMLKPAAFRGLLCFAEGEGRRVKFTRPDRWCVGWRPADPQTAEVEVVRRYLDAYGPSNRDDVSRWLAFLPAEVSRLLLRIESDLVEVEVDGTRGWLAASALPALEAATASGSVRLLPAFDPWVMGMPRAERARLAPEHHARVFRPQAWISPVLLEDGVMTGTWRHERKGRWLAVSIQPFEPIEPWARTAAEAEAERLAAFMGGALELTWS